MKTISYL